MFSGWMYYVTSSVAPQEYLLKISFLNTCGGSCKLYDESNPDSIIGNEADFFQAHKK
jgi:hypothetical protein